MKALVEIALIWGIILALILAAFLLNLWLVHLIELLVGAKGTWGIIVAAAVMATGWIFSFGSKNSQISFYHIGCSYVNGDFQITQNAIFENFYKIFFEGFRVN